MKNKLRFLLLILVASRLGAPPTWAQSSPAAVVNTFYSDWLKITQGKQPAPLSQMFAAERKLFDPTLFQAVTKTFQMEEKATPAQGVVGYDEDPFFSTQSDTAAFHLGSVSLHGENASVPVYCVEGRGGKPVGKQRLAVTVQLAQSHGTWLITDVLYTGSTGAEASLKAWSRQLTAP